jgi:hypothetical protein
LSGAIFAAALAFEFDCIAARRAIGGPLFFRLQLNAFGYA